VTNIITISLDEDTLRLLERIPKRHRSEFIRKQILKYDNDKLLPDMIEIHERLKHDDRFELKLINFVNKCRSLLTD